MNANLTASSSVIPAEPGEDVHDTGVGVSGGLPDEVKQVDGQWRAYSILNIDGTVGEDWAYVSAEELEYELLAAESWTNAVDWNPILWISNGLDTPQDAVYWLGYDQSRPDACAYCLLCSGAPWGAWCPWCCHLVHRVNHHTRYIEEVASRALDDIPPVLDNDESDFMDLMS